MIVDSDKFKICPSKSFNNKYWFLTRTLLLYFDANKIPDDIQYRDKQWEKLMCLNDNQITDCLFILYLIIDNYRCNFIIIV